MIATIAAIESMVTALAMMAVQGTVLVVVALVLTRGGRLRPAWQAAVWLVVLAKFVLPWGPTMPWSLADVFAHLRDDAPANLLVLGHAKAAVTAASPALAPAVGWIAIAVVWLAGTTIVLGRALDAYRATARAARTGYPAPPAAQQLLRQLARRVRVRVPRLVVGDPSFGPYVVGAVRPIIVVPPALIAGHVAGSEFRPLHSGHALLRAALLHELAHVRRRDALGRLVQLAAVATFWWWPVVRLASRRLELARERACDAWALEANEVSPPAYARLLLQMAQLRVAAASTLAAPHALDARIAAVLGPPARPRLGIVQRLAVLAWALVALGGARTAVAEGKQPICVYTPALAEAIRQAYPDADADGDGVLSRDEACDYQAELRRHEPAPQPQLEVEDARTPLLEEPLCCNCGDSAGLSGPLPSSTEASCSR